ncbi:hypothetical protein HYS28_03160 [Candidatus Uhrbacteria bacterium]|nr:hypothetical protein [Candidatus Uhrbacteria bacterium]
MAWFSAHEAGARGRAADLMRRAEQTVPALGSWRTTPQGGPWHCEGPVLADHVARILAGLFVIESGASLADIEEFAREKDLRLDIASLEATLRTHATFLAAFALVHDAAKPGTTSFDAPQDSRGAKEGFAVRKRDPSHPATAAECVRYDKLRRAYAAAHPGDTIDAMQGFYEECRIATHYIGHDTHGGSPEFAAVRHDVLALLGLPTSQAKLLAELVRYHIDVIQSFTKGPDAKKYEVMAARAGKAGLNVGLFLDLMLAVLFLDAVVGSVGVADGAPVAQTDLVVNVLRAERDAMPRRHAEREERAARAVKQAQKDALAAAGLDGESVFALLGTPIGPERGEVMARVMATLADPSHRPDFGPHTEEILRRAAHARTLLAAL